MGRLSLYLIGINRRVILGVACLVLSGCASVTSQTNSSASKAATSQAADESIPADRLCIVGREIRSLEDAECKGAQQAEREGQGRISQFLNRFAFEYPSDELSLDLLEGVSLGAGYKYAVEPSYRDSYFTRIDQYTFGRDVSPDSLLGDLPLGISFSRDSSLLFAQQFASGATARDPRSTYLPTKIPVTAKRALALKTGDYVRFTTGLNVLANASQVWPVGGYALRVKSGYSILLEGDYEIHMFRLDAKRVRIRLVAQRAKDRRLSGEVGTTGLSTAVLNRVDGRLEPIANLIKLDASVGAAISKSKSDLFLVDYTLDLSDAQVRAAFADVFSPSVSIQDVSIANPLRGKFALKERLRSSIEPLDMLAREDLGAPQPRVVRNFQGVNYSTSQGASFKASISRLEVNRSLLYRENFLVRSKLTENGEVQEHYLLPNWSQFRGRSMLFGMLDESQVRTSDALFIADSKGNPIQFLNIGFSLQYKDATLRPSEYRRLRRKIELLLPDAADQSLAQLLKGTRWGEDHFRRNVALELSYLFRESAFDAFVEKGFGQEEKLKEALVAFIRQSIEAEEFPLYRGSVAELLGAPATRSKEDLDHEVNSAIYARWSRPINRVSQALALAFTAGEDATRRMQAVMRLRHNKFYQQVGTAFWVDLIDRAGLDVAEAMFVKLRLAADEHMNVDYEFGASGERKLYDAVQLIQTLLNNRSLDMREIGGIDTIISRMTIVSN